MHRKKFNKTSIKNTVGIDPKIIAYACKKINVKTVYSHGYIKNKITKERLNNKET